MQGVSCLGQYNHPIESLLFVTWYHDSRFVIQLPHHQSALCSLFGGFNCCWAVGLIDLDPQRWLHLGQMPRSPAVTFFFWWWARRDPIIIPARHGIVPLSGHLHIVCRGTAPSMSHCASSTVALWFPSRMEIALRHLSRATAYCCSRAACHRPCQWCVVDSSWSPSGIQLSWTPSAAYEKIFHHGSPLFMSVSCGLSTAILLPTQHSHVLLSFEPPSHCLWSWGGSFWPPAPNINQLPAWIPPIIQR